MKKSKRKKGYTFVFKYVAAIVVLVIACTQLGMVYHTDEQYISVKVHSGDTVWQLASAVASDKQDVRDVVDEIMDINHLKHSDDIYPGQVLQVPVETSNVDAVKAALQAE